MKKDIESKNNKLSLNKKRKRNKNKDDLEEYEDSIKEKEKNKIKKEDIKNYLEFTNNNKKDIYNKYSDIESYSIARNIYSTTTQYNYNYICQEIKSDTSIKINDAKILSINDKNLLFLLSDTILYIYGIQEFIKYSLIKKIELDENNKFIFSTFPKNIFFITPQERKRKKNNNDGNNSTKKYIKDILYFCILSNNEKYLCSFDLKKYGFKNMKNFSKKNISKKLLNKEFKFKLYNHNKILAYNENSIYMQRIYGSPKFKDFKLSNIESVSLLNQNLFSICTPDIVYIYDTNNENLIGDFRTHSKNKKAKLLKPENNLLMVKSKWDVSLYDLESLMIFQKLELDIANNQDEPIQKVKQLTNNNIAILFTTCFVLYNLEKNAITYKYNINNTYQDDNGTLMEINPNFILVNNDLKNFYIMNAIKGDKIAYLNINNSDFSLCEKIKKYNFKKGETPDKNIEKNKNDNNYILFNNNQSSFVLSITKEEK